MITVIVQFVKEYKRFILALIVIVPVLLIGCYIYTLQTEISSYKSHLQSAKNENHQLLDEKKEKEKENDRINAELQSIKENNQRLLEENKEFQKKIDEITVKLQSVKGNQNLLEEKKECQKQINQIDAELQSTKESSQEVLKEKVKLLEKLDQINAEREVYSTQVTYIQKWIEVIKKLEEQIQAVIYCSESKKNRLKYSKPEMCSKINFNFEESYTNVIVIAAIDLIMKLRKECSQFWDALALKKVEEMKELQARTPLSSFQNRMEQFNEEVSGYNQKKKAERDNTREYDSDEHQWNKEKGVAKQGIIPTIESALYGFGMWVGSMIVGLFWS